MKTAHATLSNFRQAPRKMRMVADTVRGKKVSDVLTNLEFTAKKSSSPLKTLILSALANAKSQDIPTENLIVKVIKVDSGKILYRQLPAARGSAHRMRKRTCAVYVELGESSKEIRKSKAIKEATVQVKENSKKIIKSKKSKLVTRNS